MHLSSAARSVWAKTGRHDAWVIDDGAPLTHWLPLPQHLDDAAEIAARLWDKNFWAPKIRARLAERYSGSEAAARAATILLAGAHDIGKASPAFAAQCGELTHAMGQHGLKVHAEIATHPNRSIVRHELVSYLAFAEWAKPRGGRGQTCRQLASVLGAHHGRPLAAARLRFARDTPLLSGEGAWAEVRFELLDHIATHPEVAPHLDAILKSPLRQSDLVLLSGMLILADWVASSESYFPLFDLEHFPDLDQTERVSEAWRRFSPAPAWHPEPAESDDELFQQSFQLPPSATLHQTQREFVQLARRLDRPKLLILEAAMGSGKTEAALAAAEVTAARFGANGIFVALPTQATSDGMFSRVRRWAERIGAGTSVFLAHGRSALNDEFESLWADPRFNVENEGSGGRGTGSLIAHRWFAGNKKGQLSNLVVGTIDQLLFAALQSRHVSLRHLAFAGKVVVIDEAHAFDVYMGEFLSRAVHWLGAYGVPTIILSATLPADRRRELVRAYEEGRLLDQGARVSRGGASVIDTSELDGDIGYPAIVVSDNAPAVMLPQWVGREQTIAVARIGDDLSELAAVLRERMRDGGCVAIVRNTVGRAQQTAEHLRREFPDAEVLLAHSRFLAEDRARLDRGLLDRFGSQSRAVERPVRAIVVATQVIEQSLDLDFDLMVSDLAPVDLLLQRVGRLHRHERGEFERPDLMRVPRLLIAGVHWGEDPPAPVRGSRAVYGEHLLLRSLAELEGREHLLLPSDIAPMVQRVYSEAQYSQESWQAAFAAAKREFESKRAAHISEADAFRVGEVCRVSGESLLGWAEFSIGDAEHGARERKGQAVVRRTGESLEVFALFARAGTLSVAPWWELGAAGEVPLNAPPGQSLVKAILRSAVRIPEGDCARYGRWLGNNSNQECQWSGIDLLISDLERLTVEDARLLGLQQAKELKGEIVVVFDEQGNCELPGAVLRYCAREGLKVEHSEMGAAA